MGKPSDHSDQQPSRSSAGILSSLRSKKHESSERPILSDPTPPLEHHLSTEAGGLDVHHGRGSSLGPSRATGLSRGVSGAGQELPPPQHPTTRHDHVTFDGDASAGPLKSHGMGSPVQVTSAAAAASAQQSEDARVGDSALEGLGQPEPKPPFITRLTTGVRHFLVHFKNAIFRSWFNILLICVPAGIAVYAAGLDDSIVFAINAAAIVPLAGLLSYATESLALRSSNSIGALINVSFGNAVELIIFIIALVKNEISVVQASLIGSILANLLLILGMAFLFGGLRFREQIYNSTITQINACLLSLSVVSLLLPTAFHAAFNSNSEVDADEQVLKVSRGTSVILLIVYGLYLCFQLKTHSYLYASTPQALIDEESHPGVLADIMNSSSSSDDSDSSDSSGSDTSGSVMTTSKRVRRIFKNRRRRKSSASASSTQAPSTVPSALSSPSTTERQDNAWEQSIGHYQNHRHQTGLFNIMSGDEADADEQTTPPLVRDFGVRKRSDESIKAPESKSRRKMHSRKEKKHRRRRHREQAEESNEQIINEKTATTDIEPNVNITPIAEPTLLVEPTVEFSDNIEFAPSQHGPQATPGRLPSFNMKLPTRPPFRPSLPKMLSNTVFNQPTPSATPAIQARPAAVARVQASTNALRRTNSLPDRLNEQPIKPPIPTVPLPPYHHQRPLPHRTLSANVSELPGDDADDTPSEPGEEMSAIAALVMLAITTALVAVCAEFMVEAIPGMIASSNVSQAFIGLIILPIVGNAAEHVTAVTVATKNKMDLAIGVAVGSSIQIALFVTPFVVLLGWILAKDMSLYFNIFETVSLFVTAFVVNFLVLDGRSNYLEGSLLIAAYIIIAVAAFFYPSTQALSALGGGEMA